MIQTLTLNEAAAYLRERGLSISNETLAAGLEQGVFASAQPSAANGKNRVVRIFKRLLDQWIAEREVH